MLGEIVGNNLNNTSKSKKNNIFSINNLQSNKKICYIKLLIFISYNSKFFAQIQVRSVLRPGNFYR